MSDGKMKLKEKEPSFNIDELMKEIISDFDSSGINRTKIARSPVSSPFSESSMQQYKSLSIEDNSQVVTANSNMYPSMNRNSANISNGLRTTVAAFSSTSSDVYKGLAPNQNLNYMISQIDQYQQPHHHLSEMQIAYASSSRLNAHNPSNQIQQHQNLSIVSQMLQQQMSTGYLSPSRSMMGKQESCNVIQQAEQSNFEPKLQQFAQQVQMQQPVYMPPVYMQSGLLSEHAQLKLMASAFPQSQQFQLANQIIFQGSPQVQMSIPPANGWVNQAFQQIMQLKSVCLPDVEKIYRKLNEQRNRAQDNETSSKLEKAINFYGYMISFLQMSKSDIENHGAARFNRMMNYFGPHLERIRDRNSLHVQQAQQIDASFGQMITPQLYHARIVPSNYGTLTNIPGPLRQQRHLSLGASPMSSFQVGSSEGVQIPDASSNRHSLMRSAQQHSPSQVPHEGSKFGFEQGSHVTQPSSSGVHRQFTFSAPQKKATSSRKVSNLLESSSSKKNNNPNISKSRHQSLSVQQIMQKRNTGLSLRHSTSLNRCSSSLNVSSPHNSQHSSPLTEFPEPRMAPSSSTSLLSCPSLNPLTPISKHVDYEFSLLSLEESNKVSKASTALVEPPMQNEHVVERLVSSPLVKEPSIPDKDNFSHNEQYPIKRLINVVSTMSPTALQSSIQDIIAIVEMNDRMTGRLSHGESTMDIVNDLSDDVREHNDWNFASMYKTRMESRMKRQLDSIGSMPKIGCHMNDMVKRPKKKRNDELLREIKEINKKLMEVIVDARDGYDEETSIVRCSYCPIGHYGNGIPNTSPEAFPYLVIELMVTNDYPHSSPIMLDFQPPSCGESKEGKDMWLRAMSNFSSAIRELDQPISIREIAKTWGVCARGVYKELAEQNGGGDFSTTYGKWDSWNFCE